MVTGKIVGLVLAFLATVAISAGVVLAQTETETPTPTPTMTDETSETPSGAPLTGGGGLSR